MKIENKMKLIVFGHPELLDEDTLGSDVHSSLKSLAVYFDFKFDLQKHFGQPCFKCAL